MCHDKKTRSCGGICEKSHNMAYDGRTASIDGTTTQRPPQKTEGAYSNKSLGGRRRHRQQPDENKRARRHQPSERNAHAPNMPYRTPRLDRVDHKPAAREVPSVHQKPKYVWIVLFRVARHHDYFTSSSYVPVPSARAAPPRHALPR